MHKVRNIPNVNNVGYIDATIRLLVGVSALLPIFLQIPQNAWDYATILALLSIYPLSTAICRWDPVYELSNIRSTKDAVSAERDIEALLDVSKHFVSSMLGIRKLENANVAANDEMQYRKRA